MDINKRFNEIFKRTYFIILISFLFIVGLLMGLFLGGIAPSLESIFYVLRKNEKTKNSNVEINTTRVFYTYYKKNFISSNLLYLNILIPQLIIIGLIYFLKDKRIWAILYNPLLLILTYLILVSLIEPFLKSLYLMNKFEILKLSLIFPLVNPIESLLLLLIIFIMRILLTYSNILLYLFFISGLFLLSVFKLLTHSLNKNKSYKNSINAK